MENRGVRVERRTEGPMRESDRKPSRRRLEESQSYGTRDGNLKKGVREVSTEQVVKSRWSGCTH